MGAGCAPHRPELTYFKRPLATSHIFIDLVRNARTGTALRPRAHEIRAKARLCTADDFLRCTRGKSTS
jgi:hypothetical protein